jgi:hypothetical protein
MEQERALDARPRLRPRPLRMHVGQPITVPDDQSLDAAIASVEASIRSLGYAAHEARVSADDGDTSDHTSDTQEPIIECEPNIEQQG